MCFLRRNANREDGCTLIELLIGLAILGLLMILIAMTFSSTFGAIDMIGDEREIDRQARVCLASMTEELMMARMHPSFPFLGRNDAVAFVSGNRETFSQEPSLQSGSIRVVYGRDGDHVTRLALHNLYSTIPEPIERVDLASGVLTLNLRYYDQTADKWVDEWNGPSRKTVPRAVMIKLTFADAQDEPRTFSNVVIVPSQSLETVSDINHSVRVP